MAVEGRYINTWIQYNTMAFSGLMCKWKVTNVLIQSNLETLVARFSYPNLHQTKLYLLSLKDLPNSILWYVKGNALVTSIKTTGTSSGGDLAPSFGGTENFFADQDFWMTLFSENNSIFTAKISDDLSSSHRPGFSDFPFLLPDFPYLYYVTMSYMSLSSQEKHLFLLFSYFPAHPTTLLLKILGGRMHGPSPTSNFGGTVPPVPL